MFGQLFKGFQFVHGVLLALSAVSFFVFWWRTRLWLPKYAHVLAAVGLLVGLWCAYSVPADAPISRDGPAAKLLLALAVPAMVYFFFVFYGGQRSAFKRRFERSAQCPQCGEEVTVLQNWKATPYDVQRCAHCGQPLP